MNKERVMTKEEVQQRVLKDGKPLDSSLFDWDEKTNTFSSRESGLVIDFRFVSYCTFRTGPYCTFKAGDHCTFRTEEGCVFNTGGHCTFRAERDCVFDTGHSCVFNTKGDCVFNAGENCVFETGDSCTFNTLSNCTFKTGDRCIVIRRLGYEVIELKSGQKIRLNVPGVKGFVVLNEN